MEKWRLRGRESRRGFIRRQITIQKHHSSPLQLVGATRMIYVENIRHSRCKMKCVENVYPEAITQIIHSSSYTCQECSTSFPVCHGAVVEHYPIVQPSLIFQCCHGQLLHARCNHTSSCLARHATASRHIHPSFPRSRRTVSHCRHTLYFVYSCSTHTTDSLLYLMYMMSAGG